LIVALILLALGMALPASAWALRDSGGSGWHVQRASAAGGDAGLRSVCFVDATHGWAVGDSVYGPTGTSTPLIVATTSGGVPAAGPAPTITLKLGGLTGGAIKQGRSVAAKGTVTPTSLAGSKVTLTAQFKKGSTWVKAAAAATTINAVGAYIWTYAPTKKGIYRMRTAIAKTAEHASAASKWLAFKVK
jgi:hypothetical protein